MIAPLKKLFFIFTFNSSLFLLLMIGIQNSSTLNRVNLVISKTIRLPISFIVGMSFISGSIAGNFLKIDFNNKK
tara:strand:- start:1617 stop:1838 length:222 start_codon:yes stop_codon:yes gene_type:complete